MRNPASAAPLVHLITPVVQLRENTRIYFGRCGFDSHRECQFRRAVEFGLSVKSERTSGFKPRPSRQYGWVPNSPLVRQQSGPGRCALVIEPVAQLRKSSPCQWEDAGSIPVRKHRSRSLPVPRSRFHRAESRRLSNSMVECRTINPEVQVRLLRPTQSLARDSFKASRR